MRQQFLQHGRKPGIAKKTFCGKQYVKELASLPAATGNLGTPGAGQGAWGKKEYLEAGYQSGWICDRRSVVTSHNGIGHIISSNLHLLALGAGNDFAPCESPRLSCTGCNEQTCTSGTE